MGLYSGSGSKFNVFGSLTLCAASYCLILTWWRRLSLVSICCLVFSSSILASCSSCSLCVRLSWKILTFKYTKLQPVFQIRIRIISELLDPHEECGQRRYLDLPKHLWKIHGNLVEHFPCFIFSPCIWIQMEFGSDLDQDFNVCVCIGLQHSLILSKPTKFSLKTSC